MSIFEFNLTLLYCDGTKFKYKLKDISNLVTNVRHNQQHMTQVPRKGWKYYTVIKYHNDFDPTARWIKFISMEQSYWSLS